ncbi:MAG TPA: response regulator transcription factor [Solirubrobacterales bacterium]
MPGLRATVVVCVEDNAILDLICDGLDVDHFEILPAAGVADALRLCRYHHPNLLVVDLALPDEAGFELLRPTGPGDRADSRLDPDLPIIALTGPGESARARGLDLRADDHVRKPFAYEDLRARIVAVLRRGHSRGEAPVRVGGLLIDPARRKVTVGDREVHLTRREFTLLRVLASDPTRVFSRDELLRDAWGSKAPAGRTRTIESHASRLRCKLDPEGRKFVVNSWGIGYSLLRLDSDAVGR